METCYRIFLPPICKMFARSSNALIAQISSPLCYL
ncbi:unnamed protein product [Cuscuta epithymum]|uniref:Uncharacterized protein n=1 Tax=Cuscuta epithymum TaxID=186058 RepID=A0AAV0G3I5_9ASTE|nr:unnamed protein product [Cuscuta epithymum]